MHGNGLTSQEVKERVSQGLSNDKEERQSRGYFEILAKNLLTPFNVVLFILGIALLYFQELTSAIAATGVIIFNVIVSTAQEWKAKRRLDKIAVLMRPKVNAFRDGELKVIDRSEIVMDDLLFLGAGDQAQVDGVIDDEKSLEMDESLLTGESKTIRKHKGDKVFSGSYCVTGECWMKVTNVGDDTYSAKMLKKARKFEKKSTPLQTETNTVTQILMAIAFIYLVILIVINAFGGHALTTHLKQAVIVLDIVPIALFLLISLTYMIAAVRMADSGVLLQNSNSVESMSHVDTVCMDKTGTITTNNLVFEGIDYVGNDPEATEDLVRKFISVTGSRNRTVLAIEAKYGHEDVELVDEVQFSSERKFSAVRFRNGDGYRSVYMGAWPFLKDKVTDGTDVSPALKELSSKGLRSVVLFDADSAELHDASGEIVLPDLKVLAVISIRDEIRPDCKEIISKFVDNGMDIKVISGDDPETVEAIFKLAEIPGERKIISGDKLENMSEEEFSKTALETNIFGRMKPEQKERIIDSLRRNGRYVAMVGDGINDVRSIKKAQVGVAVQSGSGAARGVADMVLMNDDFKAMPQAIIEGKRTVSGMRDILRLYITRNFVLAALVLTLLLICGMCPLRPIQNSLYALLTVSIAAFLMTLCAKPSENKDLVLPGVMRFVLPTTGTITVFALAIYATFYFGTMEHWMDGAFELSSSYQEICERLNMTMEQVYSKLSIEGSPDHLVPVDLQHTAEINARNAMLLFLLISGILELIILFPLTKRLSITEDYQRDVKPTILALLLLGLTYAFYQIPEVYVTVAETLPVGDMWVFIAVAVAVWYVITLFVLKSPRLQPLSNFFDRMVRRGLQKSFEKQSRKELQEEDD